MTAQFESNCNSVGKIIYKNLHIIAHLVFFFILFILSRILSLYTDKLFLSRHTNNFSDKKSSLNKYDCKIAATTKKKSIILFIFVEFLVVVG